jgi:membrane-bound serine protease (ClpP class)
MSEGEVFNWDEELTFNFGPLMNSLLIVLLSVFLSITLSLIFSQQLVKTSLFSAIALNKTQRTDEGYLGVKTENINMVGKTGTAYTILRPGGKVEIDGEIYDAKALTGFIEEGKPIKVVKYEMAQLYVIAVEE